MDAFREAMPEETPAETDAAAKGKAAGWPNGKPGPKPKPKEPKPHREWPNGKPGPKPKVKPAEAEADAAAPPSEAAEAPAENGQQRAKAAGWPNGKPGPKPKIKPAAKTTAASKLTMQAHLKKVIAKKRLAKAPPVEEPVADVGTAERNVQDAEDDFLDDFPPAPANSVVVRRGDTVTPGEMVVALDVRGVSPCHHQPLLSYRWRHSGPVQRLR